MEIEKHSYIKTKTTSREMTYFDPLIHWLFCLFILLVPYLGGYLPRTKVGGTTLDIRHFFLVAFTFFFFLKFFLGQFRARVSPFLIALAIYMIYVLLNKNFLTGSVPPSLLFNMVTTWFTLALFENIVYTADEHKRLYVFLLVVAVGCFIASALQTFVDPTFYVGKYKEALYWIRFFSRYEGIVRNNSLFAGVGPYEAGIGISCLFLYFLFRNFREYSLKDLAIVAMLAFSVVVTYSRWIWGFALIGILVFVWYRYKQYSIVLFPAIALLLIILFLGFFSQIEQSKIYQKRIATETYKGRTETTQIFVERFFHQKPIFGFGESSWQDKEYLKFNWFGIHVAYFDIVFREGLFGLVLFVLYWIFGFLRFRKSFRITGNPMLIAFFWGYVFINFTALFDNLNYYGYFLMFYLLNLFLQNKQEPISA